MAETNCKRCRFFDGTDIGQCRRYPVYQTRFRTEWCGEFAVANLPETMPSGVFLPVLDVMPEEKKQRGRPKSVKTA